MGGSYEEDDYKPDRRRNKRKKKKKRNPIAVFFKTLFIVLIAFIVVGGVGIFAYLSLSRSGEGMGKKPVVGFFDAFLKKDIEMNVAVFGTDKDGVRTDVMFVLNFDSKNKSIQMLSIPRDTRVEITDEIQKLMKEEDRYFQSPCKINAVHGYGGKDSNGCKYAAMQLEDLLGIEIQHYVKVDLEGFRQIIDAIGGVDVVVPEGVYHYDPDPDLNIDLRNKAGEQHLNGFEALQLVRYRGYPQADIQRVATQQDFLKAVAKQVLNTSNIVNNIADYVKVAFQYVQTDISLTDALKYANYIGDIDVDNITMETLPGTPKTINGGSYYICDESATAEAVQRIFFSSQVAEPFTGNDKDLRIEVSNGGSVSGLAGKTQERLEAEGYNVTEVSTYNGERTDITRIYVAQKGMGESLKTYFPNCEITVEKTKLTKGTDMKIILGMDEK